MSIGIESGGVPSDPLAADAPGSEAFVAELARMANALFQGGGASPAGAIPSGVTPPVAPPAIGPSPSVAFPPNPGPSALALGGGGVSTSQSAPPTPGFLSTPPVASAPAPKETESA